MSIITYIEEAPAIIATGEAVIKAVDTIWEEAEVVEKEAVGDISTQVAAFNTDLAKFKTDSGVITKIEDVGKLVEDGLAISTGLGVAVSSVSASTLWTDAVTQFNSLKGQVDSLLISLGVLSTTTAPAVAATAQ